MERIFLIASLKNLLITVALQGGIWTIFLFLFCFVGVHVVKLARYGWEYQNSQQNKENANINEPKPEEQTDKKKAPEQACAQEPIYYIVERKQRRSKPRYSEPKEIRFQNKNE